MNMYEYVPTSMSPIALIKEQMASEAEPPGESRKAAPSGGPQGVVSHKPISRYPGHGSNTSVVAQRLRRGPSMRPISLIQGTNGFRSRASGQVAKGRRLRVAHRAWSHINRFPKDLPIETRPPWAPNVEDKGQVGVPKPS
jgi:hypothetical protein